MNKLDEFLKVLMPYLLSGKGKRDDPLLVDFYEINRKTPVDVSKYVDGIPCTLGTTNVVSRGGDMFLDECFFLKYTGDIYSEEYERFASLASGYLAGKITLIFGY